MRTDRAAAVKSCLADAERALLAGAVDEMAATVLRLVRLADLRTEDYLAAGRLVAKLAGGPFSETSQIRRVRVGVVGGYSTQMITAALRCSFLAEGLIAEIYEGPFGAFRQEMLDARSGLHAFRPQVLLVATGYRDLMSMPRGPHTPSECKRLVNEEVSAWRGLWHAVGDAAPAVSVLQHVFEAPYDNLRGVSERRLPWSPRRFVAEVNAKLIETAEDFVHFVDVDSLSAAVGRANWDESRLYYHAKLGWNPKYLPEYITLVMAAWRSTTGRTKKVLVVDLDDTLWGGVVADEGLDGIRLGPGTSEGEAYADFGRYLSAIAQRGVILAACSKNDPAVAEQVFRDHPHLPLRLGDFAAFVCNWENKAANLRRIAQEINVDLSSFVFADDNPAECDRVRQELPEVAVVHLSGDPAKFRALIDRHHYFDIPLLLESDVSRSRSYAGRIAANAMSARASGADDYLASLEMVAIVAPAGRAELPRLSQMQQKTNQFNLTSLRLNTAQLERLIDDPRTIVLVSSLSDKFTDHGLVASLVASRRGDDLHIIDWVMSCRVFSRTLEEFVMNVVMEHARDLDVGAIVGEYRPNGKNGVVADLYPRLGFRPVAADAEQRWSLNLSEARPCHTFVRAGAAAKAGR